MRPKLWFCTERIHLYDNRCSDKSTIFLTKSRRNVMEIEFHGKWRRGA